MRSFTTQELKRYDGKQGRPAYLAYNHTVYDVTGSFLWQDGKHMAAHFAGTDLTEELSEAPHSAALLERFLIVGTLSKD